jgi:transketolase
MRRRLVDLTTQELARLSRISTVKAVHFGKTSHVGSSLSLIDILSVLYGAVANISPDNLDDPQRDLIMVSKGHAAAGTYSVMANVGIIPMEWLDAYCADGSKLGGHVTSLSVPGVELSTGSLGHGLPYGLGHALAAKRLHSDRRIFVVMSDGECDEGTTWESALLAGHHGLDNLTLLIDRNGLQSLTTTEDTLRLEPFAAKWRDFGWDVLEIDGHDHAALTAALAPPSVSDRGGRPRVIICKTTKGKGVSFMENSVLWHYRSPNDEQLAAALAELGAE